MTCKYCDKDTDICVNADCPIVADFCPWDNHKEDCRYAEVDKYDKD